MKTKVPGIISIASFGAIRPLKNQLIQAMAAIAFANDLDMTLHFHVNYTRIETHGENVYKNLNALFNNSRHKLIVHEWLLHEDFMKLIAQMDIGLQVSFSETFNIVAADFAYLNVPIVGSKEIEWMCSLYQSEQTDLDDMVSHLWLAWLGKVVNLQAFNKMGLDRYNKKSKNVWKRYLRL